VTNMLAVHLEQGVVSVRDVPLPQRPVGLARIRMLVAGICNTDIELQRGYYGFSGTPGHEFVGEVVEADDHNLVGKRVAGEINLSCGQCEWCRGGLGRHCPTRTVLGIVNQPGAFAEYLLLPERNLHVVPDSIALEHAVFIEPLAAACEVLHQVAIGSGDRVAVLGDGKLGLLIAQVLAAHGAHVMHYGRHRSKLAIAASSEVEAIEVSSETPMPRAEFPYVVDATGSQEGLRTAVQMVRPRGTVIMKSTVHGEVAIDTAGIIVNEITLVGSRCGRFEPAIRLLEQGRVRVAPLLSSEFALNQAPQAFAEATKRGVLKVLLRNPA
jgi:threonine dehydrogenase-like Zn-dependent dehydrogenase